MNGADPWIVATFVLAAIATAGQGAIAWRCPPEQQRTTVGPVIFTLVCLAVTACFTASTVH